MSTDPFPIRRIDIDADTTVWLPAGPPPTSDAPGRAWRVRPAGVAVGAGLASAALLRLGATAAGLLAAVVLGALGVLAVIDLEFRLLPNRIVGPAVLAVLVLQAALFPGRLVECTVAGVAASLVLLVPSLVHRGAMGMGDVKLAGLLGVALGAKVLAALMVGSLACVPVALVMLVRGARGRSATLPYGPFLTFGAAVAFLV